MSSRPRAGRGATGRDGKESDLENDLLSRALESLRKAQGFNDHCKRLGTEIVALEEEIKAQGRMSHSLCYAMICFLRYQLGCSLLFMSFQAFCGLGAQILICNLQLTLY